ncbi:MAG: hypothetical protein AAB265_15175, partial [candidate division NC10 bacterium]
GLAPDGFIDGRIRGRGLGPSDHGGPDQHDETEREGSCFCHGLASVSKNYATVYSPGLNGIEVFL